MYGATDRRAESICDYQLGDGRRQAIVDFIDIGHAPAQHDDVRIENIAHHRQGTRGAINIVVKGARRVGLTNAGSGLISEPRQVP